MDSSMRMYFVLAPILLAQIWAQEYTIEGKLDLDMTQPVQKKGKKPEDQIPVIEIRGEGKPMTSAQIRALEEEAEGKPLDIKVTHTWKPANCPNKAKRRDFITFQYKLFLEDGKKLDQTYGRGPIRMQLGEGMTLPGLDKGLKGVCDTELKKIQVPYRLAQWPKSKVWKYIPKDEHWITFDVEILKVEAWTPELQFQEFDKANDSLLTAADMTQFAESMKREFGKSLSNADIDLVQLGKYFVTYFDRDGDNKVSALEYSQIMKEDDSRMKKNKKSETPKGFRRRDPGIAWVLDFNGDGYVDPNELRAAPEVVAGGKKALDDFLLEQSSKHKSNTTGKKDEL